MRLSGKISKRARNFTWEEALRSVKARELGLSNVPGPGQITAIIETAELMQVVRDRFDKAIEVTSWFRNPVVNRAVGGSRTSDHMSGRAVDFRIAGMTAMELATAIAVMPLQFDQLILYSNRVHLGWRPADGPLPNRREIKTAIKGGYIDGLWPEKARS